jgi:hypothetical protein
MNHDKRGRMDTNVLAGGAHSTEYRTIARAAALLFGISLLIGWLVGGAAIGTIQADERILLGAHIAALLGVPLLAAYGWSLPQLQFGATGRRWLTRGTIFTIFVGPLFGVLRGLLEVRAMGMNGEPVNDVMFVAMNLFSAVPTMVVAGCWIIGMWKSRPADSALRETTAYGGLRG